eukprot:scaffold2666_cov562-Prasinococcus_capsulatus_cf.AAC.4
MNKYEQRRPNTPPSAQALPARAMGRSGRASLPPRPALRAEAVLTDETAQQRATPLVAERRTPAARPRSGAGPEAHGWKASGAGRGTAGGGPLSPRNEHEAAAGKKMMMMPAGRLGLPMDGWANGRCAASGRRGATRANGRRARGPFARPLARSSADGKRQGGAEKGRAVDSFSRGPAQARTGGRACGGARPPARARPTAPQ